MAGRGPESRFLLSLTPTQDKNEGQMLTVVYSTYYAQLILNIIRMGGYWWTEGCIRHLVRARAASWRRDGGRKDGRREAPQVHRGISTAGKTQQVRLGGECYTDVVTRSVAWLTSFLFESSPLAAFMSFRKFSTVFFMFLNSPGCGVARL